MRAFVLVLVACGSTPAAAPATTPPSNTTQVSAKWVGEDELVAAGLTSKPTAKGSLLCRGRKCWCFRPLDCAPDCPTLATAIESMRQATRSFCMMEVGKQCGVTYFTASTGLESLVRYYVDDHLVGEVLSTDSGAFCDRLTAQEVRGRIPDCDEPAHDARSLCPPEHAIPGNTGNPKDTFFLP